MAAGPQRNGFSLHGRWCRGPADAVAGELGWHNENRQADEPDEFGSTPRIRRLEFEGTRDVCPWLTLPAAIAFQAEIGWENIRARNAELAAHARAVLATQYRPATPLNPALHGFLTAFHLPTQVDGPALRKYLWEEHRIEVPIIERPHGLLMRVSTHFYNTEEEIGRLAEALFAFARAGT